MTENHESATARQAHELLRGRNFSTPEERRAAAREAVTEAEATVKATLDAARLLTGGRSASTTLQAAQLLEALEYENDTNRKARRL